MNKKRTVMFSVIVVCYNEEDTILNTLCSIADQNYKNYECIVIDGCSTDNTIKQVAGFAESHSFLRYISEPDQGIYDAMNKGIGLANGKYINFMNAGDCFYDADVLGKVENCIGEHPCDVLIGSTVIKTHLKTSLSVVRESDFRVYVKRGMGYCHQSIFTYWPCLEQGFDTKYDIVADFDWFCGQVIKNKVIYPSSIIISIFDLYGVSQQAKNRKIVRREKQKILLSRFSETAINLLDETDFALEKSRAIYSLINDWLALRQRNRTLTEYFVHYNLYKVAIYGGSMLGQRLYDELRNSGSDIEVKCFIDRNKDVCKLDVPVYDRNDSFPKVDVLVITPIFDYYEIVAEMKKRFACRIVSIEDIVDYMYKTGGKEYSNE